MVRSDPGETAQVDRVELDGSDIEELPVQIGCHLGDDL
jgi:hypothetical protein